MPAGEHSLPSGPKLLSVPEAPLPATSIEKAARRCFDVSPFQVEIWTIWRCLYIQNKYLCISQIHICHISTYNQHNITYIIFGRSDTKFFIPSNTWSIHLPLQWGNLGFQLHLLKAFGAFGCFWMLLDTYHTLGSWENHRLKMPIFGGDMWSFPGGYPIPFFQLQPPSSPSFTSSLSRAASATSFARCTTVWRKAFRDTTPAALGWKTTLRWIKISVQKLQKWYFWVSAASFWEVQ